MELSLLRTQCERDTSYVLPNHHTPQATVIRLYKILRLLPQLRDLNVYRLSIRDFRRAQQFTSTLLDMVNLERLAITLGHKASYPGIAKALFFGCPPSIKRLHINRVHPCLREDYGNPYIGSRFARFEKSAAEILPRRSAQMVNLRDLSLEDWEDSATKEEFFSIFQQCPGLEKLRMIDPTVPAGVDAGIGRICPNLRDIKLKGATLSPFDIKETLPEQRLETLDYTTLSRPQLEAITIGKSFLRHSYSLQTIKIDSPTQSAALRMILGTCEGLEYLHIHRSCIDLSDAAACSPWASTKLRYLSMDINIAPPPSSSSTLPGADYVPYYFKIPSAPPATDDELIFSQLEIFYRQIGELKDMVYLYLGRTYFNERGSIVSAFKSEERPLPGMLRLRDSDVERPRFLDLLGGLSKLEIVGGSIVPETGDYRLSKDAKEVGWILEHWLSFARTPFFSSSLP